VKRKNLKYDDVITYENLENIYKLVRKGVRNKKKLYDFDNYYSSNMSHIYDILKNKKYSVGRYNIFLIYEPKCRLIMSQKIGDKIINHFVAYYYLKELLEPSLIDSNIATRCGKGTSYGVRLMKRYLNELKGDDFYILKLDIRKYFYNIDHQTLKYMLGRKIKDKDVLDLIYTIIDSTNEEYINYEIKRIGGSVNYACGKGLPIGNMTSQILAIFYLSCLDHHIKERLGIKYYLRYMDDLVLMHKDKEYLKYCLGEIKKSLEYLKLECNRKTMIISSRSGVNFLGYHFYIKENKVRIRPTNRNKRKIKRCWNKLIYKGYLKYLK